MEAKRVNILLSTYNGEKYVKAQFRRRERCPPESGHDLAD